MNAGRLLIALPMVVALCIASPLRAATPDADAAAIRQVLNRQQAAWNLGDVDGFMHGYKDAPDTTFVGSSVRKGYRAILESYRKHYAGKAQMGKLTFSDLDVRLLPGRDGEVRYAVVTGRFHLDRAAHGEVAQDDGVFSLLWEKTADGWKIILDHTS
ncbi:nuclear transport factor 2 family protein [Rhodanobacter sp. Root561]|uniref:YybH family protein n=1 Tax=Rhodanobacter sp. Root561 TaxID=1736560 RepID=UPI000AA81C14|nr:nuclear transport factor 2 family protein [Rhodanobacter sp. Root561]